jgi:hypothetical protein
MAEKVKPRQEISAEQLKKIINEASRHKATAAEYSGHHGKVIADAVEKFGLDKMSLNFARRLRDQESDKRQAVIRSSIRYWKLLGFFDQLDAFDDLRNDLADILGDDPAPAAAASEEEDDEGEEGDDAEEGARPAEDAAEWDKADPAAGTFAPADGFGAGGGVESYSVETSTQQQSTDAHKKPKRGGRRTPTPKGKITDGPGISGDDADVIGRILQ